MEKIKTSHVDTRSRLPKFFVEHVINICNQAGLRMNRLDLLNYSSVVGSQLWYVACVPDLLGGNLHYIVHFNSVGAFCCLYSYSDSEFEKIASPTVIVR